jgi:hypothetical protein
MNEFDAEEFEAELQTLKPAKPPQEALDRVQRELAVQLKQRSQPGSIITDTVGWVTVECGRPRAQNASSSQRQRHSQGLDRGRALLRPRAAALRLWILSNRLLNKLPIRNGLGLLRWVRWAVPVAAAVALVILLLAHRSPPPKQSGPRPIASSAHPLLKADNVEIDRHLIADFNAIGQLPNGDPVRFRCQQWLDKVWLRDSVAGLVIERTTPRLEIVPVRIETY